MQIESLRHRHRRVVDETTPREAVERLGKLEIVERLRAEGCSMAMALDVAGWSRATFYRWRSRFERQGCAAWWLRVGDRARAPSAMKSSS